MVSIYSAFVQASLTANADTTVIEIDAPANAIIRIRAVRVMHGDGTATASADYQRRVKLVTESVAGTGGATFTPVGLNANSGTSNVTVKTGLTAAGTVDATVDVMSQHSSTDFWWDAKDEDDKIVIKPGAMFAVVVRPSQ